MAKRKRKGRNGSSVEATPANSDSDSSGPDRKKPKRDKKAKSSRELADEYSLDDVHLEWTEADFQNLTTYNLFVQQVRPQIAKANLSITYAKLAAILKAKWLEFEDSKKRWEEEQTAKGAESGSEEKGEDEEEAEENGEEQNGDEEKASNGDDVDVEKSGGESSEEEKMPVKKDRRSSGFTATGDDIDYKLRGCCRLKIRLGGASTTTVRSESPGVRRSGRERKAPKRAGATDEDFRNALGESDVDSPASNEGRRGRKKKKKFSDEDDDFQEEKPKRTRRVKRIEPESEDAEFDEDEEEDGEEDEESDSEDDSSQASDYDDGRKKRKSRRRKKRKPVKPEKPRIPGERKSERSRKLRTLDFSDKALERIIDGESESEEEKIPKKKKRGPPTRRNIRKASHWKDDGDGDGNESDHNWYCHICKDGGNLMLCDGCNRSWHQKCLQLEEVPEGEWKCPRCTGEMEESPVEEEDDGHEGYCKVCRDGGDVILCDSCPCVYHLNCLNPPLKEAPDGEWNCPRCMAKAPKGVPQRMLTWRWTDPDAVGDEMDHTPSSPEKKLAEQKMFEGKKRPEREFFVKFRNYSYWDCEWVSEIQIEVHHWQTHNGWRRKYNMDEPPAMEDGSSFGRIRHKHRSEGDPHNLEERFYRYGVNPEWLIIHRIVNHEDVRGQKSYLVKWKGLPYDECSWEDDTTIAEGAMEDFKKKVAEYWARRKIVLKGKREKKEKPKKSQIKQLKKKLEKQPDYLDATGGTLHGYQLEGLNWLRFSWAQNTNTILADEMGLGKTIQAIAILRCLWEEGYCPGPFLITAPLSTIVNWEREFEFWAPEMYVVTYAGTKESKQVIREHEFSYQEGAFASYHKPCRFKGDHKVKFDVLLCNYELISFDCTTLGSIEWSAIVIDEAHRLKSQQSLFFRTLMSNYKINYKLLLTGTPLQNNLEELFNLLSFLQPDKFSDVEGFLAEFDEMSKDEQISKLHEMLAPHMLRRVKSDVFKEMPSKIELVVRVEMSPLQKKTYRNVLTKNFAALNVKGATNQTSLMNIMMDLRKCCNHPFLFPALERDAPITVGGYYEGQALIKACGKLELLQKMLANLKEEGHRVLIFSQMTRVLDILEDFLIYCGYTYDRIDGSITGTVRQEAIDRFNDPESKSFVFLLSTRSGGLGINLATADTVIIYDMDWNPHNDIQAFSRAHRIGQKNKVMIYRFVSRCTVEEKMVQVQKEKMMLTELVIRPGIHNKGAGLVDSSKAAKAESLTKQEINEILKFGAENLFKDDEGKAVSYDNAAIAKLLDRSQEGEVEKEFGMGEYLSSFKVATYQVREESEDEDEEKQKREEEERKKREEEEKAEEDDRSYWRRVLGASYEEHVVQQEQQAAIIAASLGKGKRVRKQVNYSEIFKDKEDKDKAKEDMVKEGISREAMKSLQDYNDDDVDDEVKYLSDYEPSTSSASEEEEDEDDADSSLRDPLIKQARSEAAKSNFEKLQRKLEKEEKKKKEEKMPPLLCKVNGQVQVLGFNARQRRAFLDAVMSFGMPPDDVYKSQWLTRDLKCKSEKVFKAYVSLFMRHLCEPQNENSTKFSDGVPREGLSRQHVLTRIGMMALIRRKVQDFEKANGLNSMDDFGLPTVVGAVNPPPQKKATPKSEPGTPAESGKEAKGDAEKSKKTEDGDKGKEEDKVKKEETGKEEDVKDDGSKDSKSADDTESKDTKVKEEANSDSKKDQDNDKSVKEDEEKSETDKVDQETDSKDSDKERTKKDDLKEEKEGFDDTKRKESESDKNTQKEEVAKTNEKESTEEEKMDVMESTEGKEEKSPEKMDVDERSDKKEGEASTSTPAQAASSDKDEEKEAAVSTDKEAEKEAKAEHSAQSIEKEADKDTNDSEQKTDSSDGAKDKTTMDSEDKSKSDEKDESTKDISKVGTSEKVDLTLDDSDEKPTSNKKESSQTKPEGAKGEKVDSKEGSPADKKDTKSTDLPEPGEMVKRGVVASNELRKALAAAQASGELQRALNIPSTPPKEPRDPRIIFYIADGGFTELHQVWQYEEGLVPPGREYDSWHRRHDYWLLAGVVTHGYRRWHEIVMDPRFDILNKPFKTDMERMKRAAFLSRRFQLLEQALVVEEQLRKAVTLTTRDKDQGAPPTTGQMMKQLDEMAVTLRSIANGKVPQDFINYPGLYQVIAQLTELVQDMRNTSYHSLPVSIVRPAS